MVWATVADINYQPHIVSMRVPVQLRPNPEHVGGHDGLSRPISLKNEVLLLM